MAGLFDDIKLYVDEILACMYLVEDVMLSLDNVSLGFSVYYLCRQQTPFNRSIK